MNKKITLLFGTGNNNKILELQKQLPMNIEVIGLASANIHTELLETRDTILGNSLQKIEQLIELYGDNCITEDTGLCVPALNGAPGVHSARYAGPQKNDDDNIDKLLYDLKDKSREAYFHTVISLYWNKKIYTFEGKCHGHILTQRQGEGGFGYDPIFMPDGFDRSFAEMSMEEKTHISHRGIAVDKLIGFINENV